MYSMRNVAGLILKKNHKTDQKWNSINEPRHEKTNNVAERYDRTPI